MSTDNPGTESAGIGSEGAPSVERASIEGSPENTLTLMAEPIRYTRQLAAIYIVLGFVVAAALIGLVVLVIKPGATSPAAWSGWAPKSGNVTSMTTQISDRVAAQYRLSEDGSQLVAVIPSTASITNGSTQVPLKAIAIRKVPQSTAGMRVIYDTSKTRMYTLCGLGKNCSIETGTPSATRGRLVRREALEAALYTFKFVPAVDQVIAFMPPAPGSTTTSVLFLEKGKLKDQLDQPLTKTLPLTTPPLPDSEDLAEAATIDKLTLKNVFSYELQALQTGGAAIILDPTS